MPRAGLLEEHFALLPVHASGSFGRHNQADTGLAPQHDMPDPTVFKRHNKGHRLYGCQRLRGIALPVGADEAGIFKIAPQR